VVLQNRDISATAVKTSCHAC